MAGPGDPLAEPGDPPAGNTGDPPAADAGAAPERTRLAWRRTGLSSAVVALLAVRPAFTPGAGPKEWLVAAGSMICWSALVAIAMHRAGGLRAPVPAAVPRSIRAYALITAALAILAGWVVML